MRSVSALDGLARGSSISRGVSIDRRELLALASSPVNSFGPATLALRDLTLELDVDVEIRRDGGFTILVGQSSYDVQKTREDK